jgi:hypothetical protein
MSTNEALRKSFIRFSFDAELSDADEAARPLPR